MNEAEFSKLIDRISSGELSRASVSGVLKAAATAVLVDTDRVRKRCKDDPKYQALGQQWWGVSLRLLGAFDTLLTYFDNQDAKLLEKTFEAASVCWNEQADLVGLLPPEMISEERLAHPPSFYHHDLEQAYTLFLEELESLVGRASQGALKRYVARYSAAIADDDRDLAEDFDSIKARREFQKLSRSLLSKLKKLAEAVVFEERAELYEEIEELVAERLAVQLELVS